MLYDTMYVHRNYIAIYTIYIHGKKKVHKIGAWRVVDEFWRVEKDGKVALLLEKR